MAYCCCFLPRLLHNGLSTKRNEKIPSGIYLPVEQLFKERWETIAHSIIRLKTDSWTKHIHLKRQKKDHHLSNPFLLLFVFYLTVSQLERFCWARPASDGQIRPFLHPIGFSFIVISFSAGKEKNKRDRAMSNDVGWPNLSLCINIFIKNPFLIWYFPSPQVTIKLKTKICVLPTAIPSRK